MTDLPVLRITASSVYEPYKDALLSFLSPCLTAVVPSKLFRIVVRFYPGIAEYGITCDVPKDFKGVGPVKTLMLQEAAERAATMVRLNHMHTDGHNLRRHYK